MAGIASGNGYNSCGRFCGVSPDSHVIAVKILDEHGQGNSAQALAGIEWIISNRRKYNIKVANLSIGTGDRNVHIPLLKAVNAAWECGITVVAASGNTGCKSTSITYPGISPRIITVGCYEDFCLPGKRESTFTGSLFSRPVQKPDILAPGEDIVSVMSPDYAFNTKSRGQQQIVDGNYITMSGTSMATPMVSGAVALLIEKEPGITPDEVKRRLLKTASHKACSFDKGLLNIRRLLE